MSKTLVIVESPTKIKTLKKFLGHDFVFESSLGHIRDLPSKGFGIDIENDFTPQYEVLEGKEKVIEQLKKAAKSCDNILLAPDPDREGEAIAWHIAAILPHKDKHIARITFNSITKEAVKEALLHPREINMDLVNAQQARRLLDRMVGYKISPLLNRRVQRGKNHAFLSAGRVQSVALKLVVDREKEIENFKPVEYWKIEAQLQAEKGSFTARLHRIDGKRIEREPSASGEKTTVSTEKEAQDVLDRLKGALYHVGAIERKDKRRHPYAPFITSTLQQEASRHFGYSASRTMKIAQELYEGIEIGQDGQEGLITYMRTDSTRAAPEAIAQARDYVLTMYGKEYLPDQPNSYVGKKNAQDAHEAIRPTNILYTPSSIQSHLSKEQFNLYTLIWKRFLASQMESALYDTMSVDIDTDKGIQFHATGSLLKFPGFLALYEEKEDDEKRQEQMLPALDLNELLKLLKLTSEQAFTKPPARFTEASLVKELERLNIGRPSTYATIMNKIQSRAYTTKEQQRLKPTELGRVIVELLEAHFQTIMDVTFTAHMEEELEHIAEHQIDWIKVLKDFWENFFPMIAQAEEHAFIPRVATELDCPKCGAKLQKIWANAKYFLGCSRYPDCDYTASLEETTFDKSEYAADFNWDQPCPLCHHPMKLRQGRFGAFLGCTQYPNCKGIVNIPKKNETPIPTTEQGPCPAIGCPGHLLQRRSRYGKIFFSCSTYPECDVIGNSIEQVEEKYRDRPRTAAAPKKTSATKKTSTTKKATTTKKTVKKPKVTRKKPSL